MVIHLILFRIVYIQPSETSCELKAESKWENPLMKLWGCKIHCFGKQKEIFMRK